MQGRHGQQQAGGEAHGKAQPLARQAEHDQRGCADAEQPAESACEKNLYQQGNVHGLKQGGLWRQFDRPH